MISSKINHKKIVKSICERHSRAKQKTPNKILNKFTKILDTTENISTKFYFRFLHEQQTHKKIKRPN